MSLVGILSDTHGFLGDYVYRYFENCDEIWHAGDIGNIEVLDKLQQFKPIKAVYGNIDGGVLKRILPESMEFDYQGMKVFLKHIVGYPGKYEKSLIELFSKSAFNLVVAGHSHILRIMYDKKHNFLFVNPGAAGYFGIHHKITLIKLEIIGNKIVSTNIWEKER